MSEGRRQMTAEQMEIKLKSLAEPQYRQFSSKLLPPEEAKTMLGVRLPQLRSLARKMAKEDWRTFLAECPDDFFEEIMLQGMIIGCVDVGPEERFCYIRNFIPKIKNWSVCDSFCAGLKFAKQFPKAVWQFLQPYLQDSGEYPARFGLVMLLDYFSQEPYTEKALRRIDAVPSKAYYARMAAAWAISVCYVHNPKVTMAYLQHSSLDVPTFNKALQKITESNRASPEGKAAIRQLKR